MLLQESAHNIGAKDEGHSTIVLGPTSDLLIRISPEEIANQSGVWDVCWAHDALDLLECSDLRGETSMHTNDLLINDGTHGHAVEHITELLPQFDVVPPLAFIVEAIDTGDGCTLMVSAKQEEVLRELDLVSEQEDDCLQALLSTVDVVTQEEVVAFWWKAAILKKAQQVVVLPVHIAANLQGRLQLQEGALVQEDRPRGSAKALHLALGNLHQLSRLSSFGFQALLDDLIIGQVFCFLHSLVEGEEMPLGWAVRALLTTFPLF
mmetsp:Transcript_75279/g.152207  ORF Transcript_75279/g.152207 Transcript_75279/m.152207 type:complete len:264 (-) Transcript_75279:29-820(-)